MTNDLDCRRHNKKRVYIMMDTIVQMCRNIFIKRIYPTWMIWRLDVAIMLATTWMSSLKDKINRNQRFELSLTMSAFLYRNYADKYYYARDGDQELRKKGQGRCLHVSDFIVKELGFHDLEKALSSDRLEELRSQNKLPENLKSRVVMYPGKNADGLWTHELLLKQVEHFMNLSELAFPDDLACIIFDCSENYAAFEKDALVVNRMNVHPGGKQSRMRSTTFVHASQRFLPAEEQTIQTQEILFLAEQINRKACCKLLENEAFLIY